MLPVEQACYWMASRARQPDAPFSGVRETDIAIVGAGFTGLWTANALKALEPKTDVLVLEQGMAAYGASGRNAGMLIESLDHSHSLAVQHFGLDEAKRLAKLGVENIDAMVAFIKGRGIDCDLERTGQLHVALKPGHLDDMRAGNEIARQLGIDDLVLMSAEETRAELNCELYLGASFSPACGILNPVKLVEGLKREAERAGASVFERTRVESIAADGAGVRLTTRADVDGGAPGEVRARKLILATNAYTHHIFPRLQSRFLPLYDYILVSEPLTAEQLSLIGWARRQGVADVRTFFNYYRLTADNRILWGTSEAAYYSGNRVDRECDHSESHYKALRESFVRHFPKLSELKFVYGWGGPICATTRFTPFFGKAEGDRILYGLGYTGHGLASTHMAGQILAHMALERDSPLLALDMVRKKPFPYPPEPLRSWAVGAVSKALRRVDAGEPPNMLLRMLDKIGIGLSS